MDDFERHGGSAVMSFKKKPLIPLMNEGKVSEADWGVEVPKALFYFIESLFNYNLSRDIDQKTQEMDDVRMFSDRYGINDINFIKPGIGETTRVLLRRVPWKVVINSKYEGSAELDHILQLAHERNVEVEYVKLLCYKCCGLIKQLSDI